MTIAALGTALCVSSLMYTAARSGQPAASRAATSASRLAADPPLVSSPPAVSGSPSQRRNHSMTTHSSWLGPLAVSQFHALML